MDDTDGGFRDDVPLADAVEQQRPSVDAASEEEVASDMALETNAADWQEQRQAVPMDPEFEELDR